MNTPTKQGLCGKLDQLQINIMCDVPGIKGMAIRTHAQAGKAEVNCIVIKTQVGDRNLAAIGGYEFSTEITYRSADSHSDRNDAMEGYIRSAFLPFSGPLLATAELEFVFEEDTETNRSDSKNLRNRTITFSGVAKEKP